MANKYANFKTVFSIDGMTIAQADVLYQKLISLLASDMKDRLSIEITDCLGGVHDPFHEKGRSPSGTNCNNCRQFDCANCPKWKKELENEKTTNAD